MAGSSRSGLRANAIYHPSGVVETVSEPSVIQGCRDSSSVYTTSNGRRPVLGDVIGETCATKSDDDDADTASSSASSREDDVPLVDHEYRNNPNL